MLFAFAARQFFQNRSLSQLPNATQRQGATRQERSLGQGKSLHVRLPTYAYVCSTPKASDGSAVKRQVMMKQKTGDRNSFSSGLLAYICICK